MTTRPWRPITPLQPSPEHDFSQDDALRQQWLDQQSRAKNAGLTALHRSWAIETRIIEGLYQLDEAQTRILVETGFEPSAVPRCGTDQDHDNLLAMLQDHMTALDAIYGEVHHWHRISRSAIRQLHQIIVAHQPSYRAMNQFGQWAELDLDDKQLSGPIPSELGNLDNLRALSLGNNQFSGCVPVKVLDMTANYVTSVGLPSC